MLKKQLCMIIICCCLAQPLLTCTTEKDTYNSAEKDIVTLSGELQDAPAKPIVYKKIDALEEIDPIDSLEDDESDFVDSCPPPAPSKTERLVVILAPYIIPLLPYYVSMAARVQSMKLRAVRYYRAIAKNQAAEHAENKKS